MRRCTSRRSVRRSTWPQRALDEKAGYFHSLLFKRLSIHTIPKLTFVHDASVEHGIEIDRLIAEANRSRSE